MRKNINDLGLLAVGLLWGLGFVVVKLAFSEGLSAVQLLFFRFFVSSIILSLLFFKQFINLRLKDFKTLFILGFLMFLAYGFQIIGSKYTTASKAAFYTALNIIFVPYVSWMLNKNSPTISTYISTIIGFIGVGFISYERGTNLFQLNIGDVLIIISSIFFGAHYAFIEKFTNMFKTPKIVLVQLYISTIGFLFMEIFLLLFTSTETIRTVSTKEFWSIIYLGAFNSGICIYAQNYFQKYVSAVKTSLLLTSESLFAPIFAYIILNENITINIIIGGIFIILSLIILEIKIFERILK